MLAMVENGQAHQQDVETLYAKSESTSFRFAAITVSLFPWSFVALAVVFAANEAIVAAYVSASVGVIGGLGPGILNAVRPQRLRPQRQSPSKAPKK